MQEHTATPLTCLHWLFGPQGDGEHGLITSTDAEIKNIFEFIIMILNQHNILTILTILLNYFELDEIFFCLPWIGMH